MNLTMHKTKLSFTLSILCLLAGFGFSSIYFNYKLMLLEQDENEKLLKRLRMINTIKRT